MGETALLPILRRKGGGVMAPKLTGALVYLVLMLVLVYLALRLGFAIVGLFA